MEENFDSAFLTNSIVNSVQFLSNVTSTNTFFSTNDFLSREFGKDCFSITGFLTFVMVRNENNYFTEEQVAISDHSCKCLFFL